MSSATFDVFISYSHDSPQHEARVLALADRLRADGIDAIIDQYQTAPPEGWQLWMEKQIRDAAFVLLVCTETYLHRVMKEDAGKGLGVMWESSMSLRLLSGLIARDTRTPGDIAAAPRHDVHAGLVQRQHHVLEQSYNALPDKERTLLSRIAAFRSPMTYNALAIFNEYGDEAKFDAALNDLQARGLLQRDAAHIRYDLHPIVRHYCYDRLTDKEGVHTRLRDYFARIPVPDENKVRSVEDLASVIELFHHTIHCGLYDEAWNLFANRLNHPLQYHLGAYQVHIELILALFPEGEHVAPQLKDEREQALTLNAMSTSYSLSGQLRHAVLVGERGNLLFEKNGDSDGIIVSLENISCDQLDLGQLVAAEQKMLRIIEISRVVKNQYDEAVAHAYCGRLLAYQGQFRESMRELDTALTLLKSEDKQSVAMLWIFRALRALLMNDAQATSEAAHRALTLSNEFAIIGYLVERVIRVYAQ